MVMFHVWSGGRAHILQTIGESIDCEEVPFPGLLHIHGDVQIRKGWNYYGFNPETAEHHAELAVDVASLRSKLYVVLGLSTPWKATLEPDLASPPDAARRRPDQALVQFYMHGALSFLSVSTEHFEERAVDLFLSEPVRRALEGAVVRIMPGIEMMSPGDDPNVSAPPLSWPEFVARVNRKLSLDPKRSTDDSASGANTPERSYAGSGVVVDKRLKDVMSVLVASVDSKQAMERDAIEQRRWLSSGDALTSILESRHGVVMPDRVPDLRPEQTIDIDECDLSKSVGASLAKIDKAALAEAEEAAIPAADVLLEELQRLLADHEAGFNAVLDAIKTATEPLAQVLQAYLRGFQGKSLEPEARDRFAKGLSTLLIALDRGLRCSSEGCELPARLRRKKNESFEFTHEGKTSGHGGQLVVPVDLTIVNRDRP